MNNSITNDGLLCEDDKQFKFPSINDLNTQLSQDVAELLSKDIEQNGSAALAVSGGRTPISFFEILSQTDIDWQKVTITLVDERWVNCDHADANEKLVRDYLLKNKAQAAQFIALKTEHESPLLAEKVLSTRLKSIQGAFSAVVLGMGLDGHTASFFPESSSLNACLDINNAQVCSHAEPSQDSATNEKMHLRMTLTLSRLLQSQQIFLQITGLEKWHIFEQARAPLSALPITTVLKNAPTLKVFWTS